MDEQRYTEMLNEACGRKAELLLKLYEQVSNQNLLIEQLDVLEQNIEMGVEDIGATRVLIDHVNKEVDELKFKIQVLKFQKAK